MLNKQKAKTAGKIIIIALSTAILLFLLLPLLDNAASESINRKKATPQIFTSNPLSGLVKKVYALFKRDSQKNAPLPQREVNDEMLASLTSEEQQKYAFLKEGEEGKNFDYSTEVDTDYEYTETGFIDKDGEWILVRQTVPESADPGMHEVSLRDNAYERHIRQERAARYAAKSAQTSDPAIPDSKWARLWKPIKSFFTGSDDIATPKAAPQEKDYLLASASSGLGKDTHKQGSTYKKGKSANVSTSEWEFGLGGNTNPLFDILSPGSTLQNVKDSYIQAARKILSGQQLRDFEEKANAYQQQNEDRVAQAVEDKNWESLREKAQDKEFDNLVEKTIYASCSDNGSSGNVSSSLYRTKENTTGQCLPPDTEDDARKAGKEKIQALKETLQIDTPEKEAAFDAQPLNMMVLLGHTKDNPFQKLLEQQSLDETTQEMIDFVLERQGCSNGETCYWVGAKDLGGNPELKYTVLYSGMEYYGDPLGHSSTMIDEFLAQKEQEGKQVEKSKEELRGFFKYVPYNKEDMLALKQQNAEKPEFVYFVPQVSEVVAMSDVLNPSLVVYDDTENHGILNDDGSTDLETRGDMLHRQILSRMKEVYENKQNTPETLEAHSILSGDLLGAALDSLDPLDAGQDGALWKEFF